MRKLVVTNIMSLDGVVEGPGGDVMALPMDPFFDQHNLERLQAADTFLLGTRTYLGFKSFWPPVADDPASVSGVAADPALIEVHREIGQRCNTIDKVVVSDTLTEAETAPWTDTTTIVRRGDAHEAVAELREGDGRDILVHGSRTLWNDLLAAGLVDELHLMIGAGVVGGGTPAFSEGVHPALHLFDVDRRDGSDNVVLRYAVG